MREINTVFNTRFQSLPIKHRVNFVTSYLRPFSDLFMSIVFKQDAHVYGLDSSKDLTQFEHPCFIIYRLLLQDVRVVILWFFVPEANEAY